MFTGIVESLGRVKALRPAGRRRAGRLDIEAPKAAGSLRKGSSLSVNGACLTVIGKSGKKLSFDLVQETERRTALGRLRPGDRVNLERPLRYNRRIEGHFVLGHVDGVGRVVKVAQKGNEKSFLVQFPRRLRRYFVEKGSVAVDGVSLTLGKVSGNRFWVHGIPHTLKSTNFGGYRTNTLVNIEADILAKLTFTNQKVYCKL